MIFAIGCLGFLVCMLGDLNDAFWHKSRLRPSFAVGVALVFASMAVMCIEGDSSVSAPWRWVFGAAGLVMLALTVTSIFFAVPPSGTAAKAGMRPAVTTGLYALCRHPGVLWFIFLCFCLWGALGLPMWAAAAFSAIDIVYALIQDRLIFPRFLDGYEEYRRTTPFLLPTPASVRRCIKG